MESFVNAIVVTDAWCILLNSFAEKICGMLYCNSVPYLIAWIQI